MKHGVLLISLSAALVLRATAAYGQVCPADHSLCTSGVCCPSSDQCCPTAAQGCCATATPYCCSDGTCAATPDECRSQGAPGCTGYDLPCGAGCIPAGSDCCSDAGRYCLPGSVCRSPETCQLGDAALQVAFHVQPTEAGGMGATPEDAGDSGTGISPLADPPIAGSRSCAMSAAQRADDSVPGAAGLGLLGTALRRRRRRAVNRAEDCRG